MARQSGEDLWFSAGRRGGGSDHLADPATRGWFATPTSTRQFLLDRLEGVTVPQIPPSTERQPPLTTAHGGPGRWQATAGPVAVSVCGAALLAAAGAGWGGSPQCFGPDTVLGPTRIPVAVSHLVTLAGLALVLIAWVGTGALVATGRVSARGVGLLAGATSIPLVLGPPLFSSDALTYVAVGDLVDRGGNAYADGWGATGRTDYVGRIPDFWRSTPSPYSPLFLRLLQAVARLTGGNLDAGALVLRLVAVVAVALTAILVVRSARRAGRSSAGALWLGIANPVVLLGGVSGAHLDALVAPLLVVAFLLLADARALPAGVALGLAGQVKVTAFVAVAVVAAWAVLRERGPARRAGLVAVAVAVVVFVALSEICSLGWGWTTTLGIPGTSNNSQTAIDAISDLGYRVGLIGHSGPVPLSGATRPTELVALALAAIGCLVLVTARQLDSAEAAGWALVLVSMLSGAVWFWYLVPAVALIAGAPDRPGRIWRWSGLAALGALLLVGLTPSGAPAASLQTVVGDGAYLSGYVVVVALLAYGFIRGRAIRPARSEVRPNRVHTVIR